MKNYKSSDAPVENQPARDLRIYSEAIHTANNRTYFNLEVHYKSSDAPVKNQPARDLRVYSEAIHKANNRTCFNLEVQNV